MYVWVKTAAKTRDTTSKHQGKKEVLHLEGTSWISWFSGSWCALWSSASFSLAFAERCTRSQIFLAILRRFWTILWLFMASLTMRSIVTRKTTNLQSYTRQRGKWFCWSVCMLLNSCWTVPVLILQGPGALKLKLSSDFLLGSAS